MMLMLSARLILLFSEYSHVKVILLASYLLMWVPIFSQTPEILKPSTQAGHYLPDFSYAGYQNGEKIKGTFEDAVILNVSEYGAIPDDGLDDSKALLSVLSEVDKTLKPVIIQFPKGQFILSEILYISRNNIILRGTGTGANGTKIYVPRPMKYLKDPESLQELREYLLKFDKQQREKEHNIDLPFSQYAWSGGMIWVQKPDTRVKSYLPKYAVERRELSLVTSGRQGSLVCTVKSIDKLKVGDVVQVEWYNKSGEKGTLIDELYQTRDLKIGSHHWEFSEEALIKQQVRITQINDKQIILSSPLLHDVKSEWHTTISEWSHLENIGIEHLTIEFPIAETIAHHVEEGFNAIYLTRLYDGWIHDVKVVNSDAGVLTEEVANVTISEVVTLGKKLAHYSVQIGGVHNVLVDNLRVENEVRHPLSFNTFATKSVYKDCEVLVNPILDQHSGANHQNLFDNIRVHVSLSGEKSYPLFAGGGAGYWKPSHGAYNTFWNIQIHFLDGLDASEKILLDGMQDGVSARLIGVHANMPIALAYGPNAYFEWTNKPVLEIPSLYKYQLEKRLGE